MKDFTLSGIALSKEFSNQRNIFSNIEINLQNGQILFITGKNGSGKTTFLKILAGIISPTTGKVLFKLDSNEISYERFYMHYGYVSPYLILYEEFTPLEHINIFNMLRGTKHSKEEITSALETVQLFKRRDDPIKTFSSGMKQRMKYLLATLSEGEILFLDEPYTNLDDEGIQIVRNIIEKHLKNMGAIVIATNDDREKSFASEKQIFIAL